MYVLFNLKYNNYFTGLLNNQKFTISCLRCLLECVHYYLFMLVYFVCGLLYSILSLYLIYVFSLCYGLIIRFMFFLLFCVSLFILCDSVLLCCFVYCLFPCILLSVFHLRTLVLTTATGWKPSCS